MRGEREGEGERGRGNREGQRGKERYDGGREGGDRREAVFETNDTEKPEKEHAANRRSYAPPRELLAVVRGDREHLCARSPTNTHGRESKSYKY